MQKVTTDYLKGKDTLQSVIKSRSKFQENFAHLTEKSKFHFCTSLLLILKFIHSIKFIPIFAHPECGASRTKDDPA